MDCPSKEGSPPPSSSSKKQKTSHAVATGADVSRRSTTAINQMPVTKCAAGVLCKHPEVDVTSSTHHCFHCSQRMHCALWCGANWLTLITTTNITIDQLTPEARETVQYGDHETINMCHACINRILQPPSEENSTEEASSATKVTVPSLPPMSSMSFGASSVSTSSVSVDESVVNHVPTKTDWKLVKPPRNTRSRYWQYFLKFDTNVHKDKEEVAVCKICLDGGKHIELSTKDGNTSSIIGHIQNIHTSIYDSMQQQKKSEKSNSQQGSESNKNSITSFLKPKRSTLVVKHLFVKAATASIIDNAFPLSVVEKTSFRRMFLPLNKEAERIVNVNRRAIRISILNMGRMAKAATILELTGKKLSYTLDHWTGPNNWTYGAATGHHIDPLSWMMCSSLLDFKVFVGRTTGAMIFEDISSVLSQFNRAESMLLADTDNSTYSAPTAENTVMGVTDTTGNMGKLGEYLRDNGQEHAYCFGHLIHLVAGIAFDRKSFMMV